MEVLAKLRGAVGSTATTAMRTESPGGRFSAISQAIRDTGIALDKFGAK